MLKYMNFSSEIDAAVSRGYIVQLNNVDSDSIFSFEVLSLGVMGK